MMKFPQNYDGNVRNNNYNVYVSGPHTTLSSVSTDKNQIKYFPVLSEEIQRKIKIHCFKNKWPDQSRYSIIYAPVSWLIPGLCPDRNSFKIEFNQ